MSKSLDWIGLNQAKICYTQQFTLINQTLKDDHVHRESTWLTNEIVTGRAFGDRLSSKCYVYPDKRSTREQLSNDYARQT